MLLPTSRIRQPPLTAHKYTRWIYSFIHTTSRCTVLWQRNMARLDYNNNSNTHHRRDHNNEQPTQHNHSRHCIYGILIIIMIRLHFARSTATTMIKYPATIFCHGKRMATVSLENIMIHIIGAAYIMIQTDPTDNWQHIYHFLCHQIRSSPTHTIHTPSTQQPSSLHTTSSLPVVSTKSEIGTGNIDIYILL